MTRLTVSIDGHSFDVELELLPRNEPQYCVKVNGEPVQITLPLPSSSPGTLEWAIVQDHLYEISCDPDLRWIRNGGDAHRVGVRNQEINSKRNRCGDGKVKAPIPGRILELRVRQGQKIEAGQTLLLLEAMKMQNEVRAPHAGTICSVNVTPGEDVARGKVMVEIG